MPKVRAEICSFVLAAVLLFCPAGSNAADPAQGSDSKWAKPLVQISVSDSLFSAPNIEGDARDAVIRGVTAWNSAAGVDLAVKGSQFQSVSPAGIRGDGVSLVTAAPTAENLRLFPKQADSAAATTRIFTDGFGNITEADIVLNPFVKFSTTGAYGTFDLQATITHEVGHLLGLEHSKVWGSVMFGRSGPNYGTQVPKAGPPLPDVDAATLRGLYGARADDSSCCGVVLGRLSGLPKLSKGASIVVWLEERETGRLIAAASPNDGMRYEIPGLSEGSYRIRIAVEIGAEMVASDDGFVNVEVAGLTRHDFKLTPKRSTFSLDLIGTTARIANLPAILGGDRPRSLYLGGKGLDSNVALIGISGTAISLGPESFRLAEYGKSVRVIGLDLPDEPAISAGVYTIIAEDPGGVRRFLIGALTVVRS